MLSALVLIPADRHPADVPHLRPAARARRRRRARLALRRLPGRARGGVRASGRHGQGDRFRNDPLRGRIRAAVHPRDRERGRRARPRAQRGSGRPLDLPPRELPHRRLLGQLPRPPVRLPPASSGADRDPRQRRRHDRPQLRPLLARDRGRRRRDRCRADRGRLPLLRHGLEREPHHLRRRRAPVAAPLRGRLRDDRRRRLPPALHPVLHGDEGVLRAGPRQARPGRRSSSSTSATRRATTSSSGLSAGRWRASSRPSSATRPSRRTR